MNKDSVYLSLDKKFFVKNMKSMEEKALKDMGSEDGKDILLADFDFEYPEELYFEDGSIHASFDTPLGFISVNFKINDDVAFKIVEHLREKGLRLKKLINLVE